MVAGEEGNNDGGQLSAAGQVGEMGEVEDGRFGKTTWTHAAGDAMASTALVAGCCESVPVWGPGRHWRSNNFGSTLSPIVQLLALTYGQRW